MGVIRRTFSLPPIYIVRIKKGANILGISESEFVRRAIDEFLLKYGVFEKINSEGSRNGQKQRR